MEPELQTRSAVKARRRLRVWPLIVLLALAFFASGGLGYYLASVSSLSPLVVPIPGVTNRPQPMNLLVLGVDRRETERGRADTLMLVFLDPAAGRVGVLSLPRDTYVVVPGHGRTKLAHAHAYGGPELAVETVEGLLGVPVDHYLEVDFASFVRLVDLLGGVEIEVPQRMYYPPEGIDLKPGRQRLNGEDALALVRFRNYPEGDIGRIRQQQRFLLALMDQMVSLRGVLKSPQLLQELYGLVKTDLSWTELLSLAKVFSDLEGSHLSLALLPGTPDYINGVSYWIPDTERLRSTLAELQNPPTANQAQAKEP
ncbi:MAG: LCP family protein [Moorellales bacterium]